MTIPISTRCSALGVTRIALGALFALGPAADERSGPRVNDNYNDNYNGNCGTRMTRMKRGSTRIDRDRPRGSGREGLKRIFGG